MAVVIIIRRVARNDRINEFLKGYHSQRPDHPGFIAEYLTEVNTDTDLPEGLKNLPMAAQGGATYLNIAFWRSAKEFDDHFGPEITHDPDTELEDRQRIVLDIREGVGALPESFWEQ